MNAPEFFKAWAESHPQTAQALMKELETKPSGGFTCYLRFSKPKANHDALPHQG